MFRKKIISALLENAFLSLFEHYRDCPLEAADHAHESENVAKKIFLPDSNGAGNGTMRRIRDEYFIPYTRRRRERLADDYHE